MLKTSVTFSEFKHHFNGHSLQEKILDSFPRIFISCSVMKILDKWSQLLIFLDKLQDFGSPRASLCLKPVY